MAQHERNKDRQSGEQSKTDRSMGQQQGTSDNRSRQDRGMGKRENISADRDKTPDTNRSPERRSSDSERRGSEDEERGVI